MSGARRGIAYVPQGREIFPLLTVEENLKTGFRAAQAGATATFPKDVYSLFPVLKDMLHRRGGDPLRRPAAATGDRPARWVMRAAASAAGRADRGHPAVDHQGHRPAPSPISARSARSPSCWWSNTWTSPASWATVSRVMDRGAVVYSTWRARDGRGGTEEGTGNLRAFAVGQAAALSDAVSSKTSSRQTEFAQCVRGQPLRRPDRAVGRGA